LLLRRLVENILFANYILYACVEVEMLVEYKSVGVEEEMPFSLKTDA